MASGSAPGRRHRNGVPRGRSAHRRGRPRCHPGPHGVLGLSGGGAAPGSLPAEDQSGPRTTARPGAVHHESRPHGPAVRSPMACRRVRARGPDRCPRHPGPTGLLPAARQPVSLASSNWRPMPASHAGVAASYGVRPVSTGSPAGWTRKRRGRSSGRPGSIRGSRWLYEATVRLRIFRRTSSGPHPVPWNTGGSHVMVR